MKLNYNNIKSLIFFGYETEEQNNLIIDNFSILKEKSYDDLLIIIKKNITNDKYISSTFAECLFDSYKKDIDEINNKYSNSFISIKYNKLSVNQWNKLRIVSLCFGLFYISHIFRNKCKENILNSKGIYCSMSRLLCYFENKDLNKAESLLNSNFLFFFRRKKNVYRYYELLNLYENKVEKKDKYYEYIKNKRLVLIGPGTNIKNNLEISKLNDRIVRFNYLDSDKNDTQISYYSYSTTNNILNNRLYDVSNLEFICTKTDYFDVKDNVRRINGFGKVFPFGNAFMFQRFILDLMYYKFDNIYVTGINLYLSKKMYRKEYLTKNPKNNSEILKNVVAFSGHDIEGNFILAKTLYKNNRFICDEKLNNILMTSVDEYMKQLEKIYRYSFND